MMKILIKHYIVAKQLDVTFTVCLGVMVHYTIKKHPFI